MTLNLDNSKQFLNQLQTFIPSQIDNRFHKEDAELIDDQIQNLLNSNVSEDLLYLGTIDLAKRIMELNMDILRYNPVFDVVSFILLPECKSVSRGESYKSQLILAAASSNEKQIEMFESISVNGKEIDLANGLKFEINTQNLPIGTNRFEIICRMKTMNLGQKEFRQTVEFEVE